jgi:HD-GYP domain-containing protein (c-di-GMP phosphodiesterase class II)
MQVSYLKTDLPGEKLIKSLYYVISSARIHQDNNQLIRDGVSQLKSSLDELSRGDDVSIQIWRGRFHIQGEKLIYRRDTFNIIKEMIEYFSRRGLGGLCFLPTSKGASHESVVAFIRLLNECVKRENASEWLDMQLEKNRLAWVEIFQKPDESQENEGQTSGQEEGMSREEKAQRAYFYALDTLKAAAGQSSSVMGGIRKARRLAQTIVDMAQEDSSLLLGLATTKDFENYTYVHSVNVALIATCLGRHAGLSRVFLEYLAISALYHDLGRLGGSKEVFFKQGELGTEEWDKMRRHPLISVKEIIKMNTPKSLRTRIVPGVFEHHLNCDLTGNPKTHFVQSLSLFGKILRIADVYEALTSERGSSATAFTPDEALRHMWSEREKSFDPLLMKHFIHMMGIYPIGTIVELSTGETAIVMDYLSDADKTLPYVMLLKDDGMGRLVAGEKIDLASPDTAEGSPVRSIAKTIHFSELGIQPSEFFQQGVGAAFDLTAA